MRTTYGIVLVLTMAAIMLLTTAPACGAEEKKEENIWSEGKPKRGPGQFELTEEVIKRVMNQLAKTEPAKAKELEQLRKKDAEKFKAELRKVMREQFGKKLRERGEQRTGRRSRQGQEMPFAKPGMAGEPPRGREREMDRERRRERYAEFLEWLEKDYSETAKELAELKEKKPELYRRQLWLIYRKYRRIFEASKENPKLAEVLKEDLELKGKRDKLLGKIRAATDEDEKKKLSKQLAEVVSSRFDLIVKRKQIAYEQLRKELEELKERVRQSEAEVEKWKEVKDEKVKERVEKLVSRTEKFKWD